MYKHIFISPWGYCTDHNSLPLLAAKFVRFPSHHRYATRAINAVAVLQLRNYVDDSQHGTFRALGVVRMGIGGRKGSATAWTARIERKIPIPSFI